jgi:hypothetical protein
VTPNLRFEQLNSGLRHALTAGADPFRQALSEFIAFNDSLPVEKRHQKIHLNMKSANFKLNATNLVIPYELEIENAKFESFILERPKVERRLALINCTFNGDVKITKIVPGLSIFFDGVNGASSWRISESNFETLSFGGGGNFSGTVNLEKITAKSLHWRLGAHLFAEQVSAKWSEFALNAEMSRADLFWSKFDEFKWDKSHSTSGQLHAFKSRFGRFEALNEIVDGDIYFEKCWFERFSWKGGEFRKGLNFNGSTFEKAPDISMRFSENTDFYNVTLKEYMPGEAEAAYRKIKIGMRQVHHDAASALFAAAELKCKRKRHDFGSWDWIISTLYLVFCDYGESALRPFLFMLAFLVFGCFVFSQPGALVSVSENSTMWIASPTIFEDGYKGFLGISTAGFLYSLGNTFGPLRLFTGPRAIDTGGVGFYLFSAFHSIACGIFFFLFLLAVRRRLRLSV